MTGYTPLPSSPEPQPIERQARLRRQASPPEGLLWSRLRARRLGGLKFRRQHPIGPYVADFYCAAAKLVIEIDGVRHGEDDRPRRDKARDEYMKRAGLHTIRFSAMDSGRDADAVAHRILAVAQSRIASLRDER